MDAVLYVVVSTLVKFLQALPLRWVARIGRAGGGLAYHVDGRHRRVETLVTTLGAGAVDRLLQRVGGQHSERHRNPGLRCDVGDPFGRFPRYVVEVWRLAPDHGAQRHQARVRTRVCRGRRSRGKLERSWHPYHVNLFPGQSGFAAAGEGTFEQSLGDQLVVAAHQDRHSPRGAKATGKVGHGVSE